MANLKQLKEAKEIGESMISYLEYVLCCSERYEEIHNFDTGFSAGIHLKRAIKYFKLNQGLIMNAIEALESGDSHA